MKIDNAYKSAIVAAGVNMCENEAWKRTWLRCYLSTHPKFQGEEITEALIDKWMDGCNKAGYVSIIMRCTHT